MKYLNQMNFVVMLAGCIVVVYAFAVTFWQRDAAVTRRTVFPKLENPSETGAPLIMRRATTTAAAAIVERPAPRRMRRPQEQSSVASEETGLPATTVDQASQPSRPAEATRTQTVGERQQAVTVDRSEPEPTSSGSSVQRSMPEDDRIISRRRPMQPSGAAEAQKREESRSNSSTPPVRSSMMGRRPQ